MKEFKLFKAGPLEVTAVPSAFVGFAALWGLLSWIGVRWFKFSWREALPAGGAAAFLHYASDLWHHVGHAYAAGKTGFPMQRVRFWGVLGTSVYPEDEPMLAADIHIQRAVGGPIASAILSLIFGLVTFAVRPLGGVLYRVTTFLLFDNFVMLTLGAFFPLQWTDGGTILYWWPRRNQKNLVIK